MLNSRLPHVREVAGMPRAAGAPPRQQRRIYRTWTGSHDRHLATSHAPRSERGAVIDAGSRRLADFLHGRQPAGPAGGIGVGAGAAGPLGRKPPGDANSIAPGQPGPGAGLSAPGQNQEGGSRRRIGGPRPGGAARADGRWPRTAHSAACFRAPRTRCWTWMKWPASIRRQRIGTCSESAARICAGAAGWSHAARAGADGDGRDRGNAGPEPDRSEHPAARARAAALGRLRPAASRADGLRRGRG